MNNSIPTYDRFHSHVVPDIYTALAVVDDISEIGPESWMLGMEEVGTTRRGNEQVKGRVIARSKVT
jgi:hypothetical protein